MNGYRRFLELLKRIATTNNSRQPFKLHKGISEDVNNLTLEAVKAGLISEKAKNSYWLTNKGKAVLAGS